MSTLSTLHDEQDPILQAKKAAMKLALREGFCVKYHDVVMVVTAIRPNQDRHNDTHDEIDVVGVGQSGIIIRAHAVDLMQAVKGGHLKRLKQPWHPPVKEGNWTPFNKEAEPVKTNLYKWIEIKGNAHQILDAWTMQPANVGKDGIFRLGREFIAMQTRAFASGEVHPHLVEPIIYIEENMPFLTGEKAEAMNEKLKAHERELNLYGWSNNMAGVRKPYGRSLHI